MQNLKLKWLEWDSNTEHFCSEKNTQTFSQTGQMVKLRCEYLSKQCIWRYVLIMSHARFIVNPRSIVAWMSRNSLSKKKCKIWGLSGCNGTRSHNHLVRIDTLNHLDKLVKLLSCVVSTCLSVHCILLYVLIMLQTHECQGPSCSKKARNLKFKWLQWDSNLQPLSS